MFGAHRMPVGMRVSYECDSKAGFFYGLMYGAMIAYFPYIVLKSLGGDNQHVQLIAQASFFGATMTIFWTRWFQNFRKLPLVVWTKSIARALLLVLPLISGAWTFSALVFIFWTIELMASPAYSGIMKEVYLDSHRGLAMGYVRIHVCMGQVLGSVISGFVLHTPGKPGETSVWDHLPRVIAPGPHNYTWLFPLGVAAGLTGMIFFHRLRRWSDLGDFTARQTETHLVRHILELLRTEPALRNAQIVLTVIGLTNLMCGALYPVFQVRVLHIEYEQVAVLSAVQAVTAIASYYIFGSIVDRRNLLAWHAWTFLFFMASTLFYTLSASFTGIVFATLCDGMGGGGWDLVRNNFLIRIAPRNRPQSVFTLDLFLMGLRGIAAPPLAFWILARFDSYRLVFVLNLVVGAAGCAWLLWMARHYGDVHAAHSRKR